MVIDVAKADGTLQRQIGHPIKFSDTVCQTTSIGCKLGAHTDDVLLEAGFSKETLEHYRSQKLFG